MSLIKHAIKQNHEPTIILCSFVAAIVLHLFVLAWLSLRGFAVPQDPPEKKVVKVEFRIQNDSLPLQEEASLKITPKPEQDDLRVSQPSRRSVPARLRENKSESIVMNEDVNTSPQEPSEERDVNLSVPSFSSIQNGYSFNKFQDSSAKNAEYKAKIDKVDVPLQQETPLSRGIAAAVVPDCKDHQVGGGLLGLPVLIVDAIRGRCK